MIVKGVYSYLYWPRTVPSLPTLYKACPQLPTGLNVLSISRVACIAKRLEQVFEHYYCYTIIPNRYNLKL